MGKGVGQFLQIAGAIVSMWYPPVGMLIMAAGSQFVAQAQQQEMERRAVEAWNASVKDRNMIVRSSVASAQLLLGEVNTGGVLTYAQSTGQYQENLAMILTIADHEIESVTHIYVDDEDICPLQGDGGARLGSRYTAQTGGTQLIWWKATVDGTGKAVMPGIPTSIAAVFEWRTDYFLNMGPAVNWVYNAGNNYLMVSPAYSGKTLFIWATTGPATGTTSKIYCTGSQYRGQPGQTVWQWLVDNSSGAWKSTATGDGIAYLGFIMIYSEALFPNGIPPMRIIARGAKAYDPRKDSTYPGGSGSHRFNNSATWEWTRNPALLAGWYMTYKLGMNLPADEVDWPCVVTAANICDESVTVTTTGGNVNQVRYACDTVLSTATDKIENLDIILTAMGGSRSYSQGKMRIFAGGYTAPIMTIDETMLAEGDIQVSGRLPKDALFNTVKGTFFDPNKGWEQTDVPQITNSTYKTQDGGQELLRDIPLPATTDVIMAQRLLKIALEDSRQATSLSANFNMKVYKLQPGDFVWANFGRYGWTTKAFRVHEREFDFAAGIKLALKETTSTIWDPTLMATQTDSAPNTNLPDPYYIPTLTGHVAESGTAQLLRLTDGTLVSQIKVSWTPNLEPQLAAVEVHYAHYLDGVWMALPPVVGGDSSVYIQPVIDGHTYFIRVRAVNGLGAKGDWAYIQHQVIGKLQPPSQVGSVTVSANQFGITISWTPISDPDLAFYEVRRGSTWDTGVTVDKPLATNTSDTIKGAGTYLYWVAAVDTVGNYSTNKTSGQVIIVGPPAPTASGVFSGSAVVLTFSATATQFAIDQYAIRYGASWGAGAATEVRTYGTTISFPVNWSGTRDYWVAAVDIAGNVGNATQVAMAVPPPNAVTNFRADVVDNNVLFYWSTPSSTLPIAKYEIRKGSTWAGGTVIGSNGPSNFTTYFEQNAGQYTYWIAAVDTADNYGTAVSIIINVAAPPDFKLQINRDSTFQNETGVSGATLSSMAKDGTSLVGPINPSETWTDHFVNNSKTTFDDFIAAPYSYYPQPTPSSGYYEEVYDYGANLTQSTITMLRNGIDLFGTVSVTPSLKISSDNVDWSRDLGNVWTAFATNFRYVKFRVTFNTSNAGMQQTTQLNERLGVKLKTLSGRVVALSADDAAGGTPFYLTDNGLVSGNAYFIDVDSLVLTAEGTTPLIPVLNFNDQPNPTLARVKVFNDAGVIQNNIGVRWEARGV